MRVRAALRVSVSCDHLFVCGALSAALSLAKGLYALDAFPNGDEPSSAPTHSPTSSGDLRPWVRDLVLTTAREKLYLHTRTARTLFASASQALDTHTRPCVGALALVQG